MARARTKKKPTAPRRRSLRFQRLTVAPWRGDKGMTYSLFALDHEGHVFRYQPARDGWLRIGALPVEAEPYEDYTGAKF